MDGLKESGESRRDGWTDWGRELQRIGEAIGEKSWRQAWEEMRQGS